MNTELIILLSFLQYETDYSSLSKVKQKTISKLVEEHQGLYDLSEYLVENVIEPLKKVDEIEKQVRDNNIMLRNLCKHFGVSTY